jgi:pyrroloquinoline quinone biosynthesis protein E
MKIRPEYHKILLSANEGVIEIDAGYYSLLYEALDGADNAIGNALRTAQFDFDEQALREIKNAAELSMAIPPSPHEYFRFPIQMTFELTTKCPLRCPQCYCSLEKGKDLNFERARAVLQEGAANGLWHVSLSGGETMCYPRLYDLLEECAKLGVSNTIAVSGCGVDKTAVDRLIGAGTNAICVSLNGSTEEINSHTRDGYAYALHTLELLQEANFPNTVVNFVVHDTNCDDFPNMVGLCEAYGVSKLAVIAAKPTSKHELKTVPGSEQTARLAKNIQAAQARSAVTIGVENCYSPLKAWLGRSFLWGSTNTGIWRGCSAGRYTISLDVDGNFTPCRQLPLAEQFKTIAEYWNHSEILNKIRGIDDSPAKPCAGCAYERYCLSCLAINYKIEGQLAKRNPYCSMGEFAHAGVDMR